MTKLDFGIFLVGFLASLGMFKVIVNTPLRQKFNFEEHYLPQLSWGLLIYFLIFKVARWCAAPSKLIRVGYETLAIASLISLVIWLCWQCFSLEHRSFLINRFERKKTFLSILLVFLFMVSLGAYLEFPSDSIFHLNSIQAWEKVTLMDFGLGSKTYDRFIYFFQHWLLGYSDLNLGVRSGLVLWGAALQTMLFWQFVRLTRLLTNSIVLGWFGGLMSLGYFGYSAFSFYRYTAFGGATIAQICCTEGFILIFAAFVKEEIRYLILLPPILFFCYGNHEQETLLLINALVGISGLLLLFRRREFTRKLVWLMSLIVFLSSIFTAYILITKEPLARNLGPVSSRVNLTVLFEINGIQAVVHDFSILNIMTGFLGWGAAVMAFTFLCFKKSSRNLDVISAVAVWPWLFLLNPIGIKVLDRYMISDVFHRLIYGSLYWIFLIVSLPYVLKLLKGESFLSARFQMINRILINFKENHMAYFLAALLVGISWIQSAPVYGKTSHLFLKPEAHLDGRNLTEPIQYLRQVAGEHCFDTNADSTVLPIRSWVLSDPYTNAYLSGTGYFYTVSNRFGRPGFESPQVPLSTLITQQEVSYQDFLKRMKEYNICYIFMYSTSNKVESKSAKWVGHWAIDYADPQNYYSSDFIDWVSNNPQDFELEYENKESKIFKVL
ncbi:MAG: hypothetical protein ACFB0E_18855 [Leptolyngbyaceae cyanobacterium]